MTNQHLAVKLNRFDVLREPADFLPNVALEFDTVRKPFAKILAQTWGVIFKICVQKVSAPGFVSNPKMTIFTYADSRFGKGICIHQIGNMLLHQILSKRVTQISPNLSGDLIGYCRHNEQNPS